MTKPGRNDVCTCGSGKKYKKCCGKNVISMDLILESELNEIQADMYGSIVEKYRSEINTYMNNYYKEFPVPKEVLDVFNFFASTWFITSVPINGETLLEAYIDENKDTFKRPRVKDVLDSWKIAKPSVFKTTLNKVLGYTIFEDIFTKEKHQVKVFRQMENEAEIGIALGTILPIDKTAVLFMTAFQLFDSESLNQDSAIVRLYDNSGEKSPGIFMQNEFLKVLEILIFGNDDLSIDQPEWTSPQHQQVFENYEAYNKACGQPDYVVDLGFSLWDKYCATKNPSIRKTAIYEAALVYLVDQVIPGDGIYTQKQLADEFGVSSSSISTKYKELENVLQSDIEEIRHKLEEEKLKQEKTLIDVK